jgi:hypothetical protein
MCVGSADVRFRQCRNVVALLIAVMSMTQIRHTFFALFPAEKARRDRDREFETRY